MTDPFSLTVTTAFGLEAVVSRELKALGYDDQNVQDGRVHFTGDDRAVCRSNLWLRSGDRVLLRIGEFEARDFGELFDQTNALPWERWLTRAAEFPVNGRSVKSQLHSVPDCQRIVKKAIVERLKSVYGVNWLDETGPKYPIEVAMLRDVATLTIDTSGDGLHKRGYRKLTAKAPLKETLAAALVQLSVWNRDRPFHDPFCGSGTIPIEAALIALNRAPGIQRQFAASHWPQIERACWDQSREEARDLERPAPDNVLIGTDIDAEVLSLARYHAKQAGVDELIHFQQQPFAEVSSKRRFGCLIANPPYGERLEDKTEIDKLYRSLSPVLNALDSWSHFIMTTDARLEAVLNRKATRRRKLYNGRLECTYYQFLGPRPPRSEPSAEAPLTSENE